MAREAARELFAELKSRPGRNSLPGAITRTVFIGLSLFFLSALLIAPLVSVFSMAFDKGIEAFLHSFSDSDALAAIRLTLLTAAIVVPLNTVFGITAAWAIAKFEFKGKSILITAIDLPIAVSPVISGLIYVLVFGAQGWFGQWLIERNYSIIFAVPGIVLA